MWIPVARSLQEVRQLQFFQLFMKRSSNGDDDRKSVHPMDPNRKKKVVRMLKVVEAIDHGCVDATEAGQKQQERRSLAVIVNNSPRCRNPPEPS